MRFLLTVLLAGFIGSAWGASNEEKPVSVSLAAVLGQKVVLVVDGERVVASDGEQINDELQLLRHDHEMAVLQYDGEEMIVRLGEGPVSANYTPKAAGEEIRVFKDSQGMFRTSGLINGRLVSFMVDTGATYISMGTHHAEALGIDFIRLSRGKRTAVSTANGVTAAFPIVLDSVKVGAIEEHFVPALIIEGKGSSDILLGMSFLERLNVSQSNGVLLLKSD